MYKRQGWRLYYKNRSHSVYFMEEKYGTEGNLMSRDLVAREIAMCPGQVYLENAKESIPVTPAIHFFMGGIKAVSYTHLDVYKRQPRESLKSNRGIT